MNANLPSWSDLELFVALAREGTLTRAAAALGVNASTVQRRALKLERELGARLFDRGARGYSLTPAGEDLYRHASAMEDLALRATRSVLGRDASLEGAVRVATVDDLALEVLPELVARFQAAHPRVRVDLDVSASFADLERREADVALRIGARPERDDLVVRHVTRVDVALYASEDYLAAHGLPADAGDLSRLAVIRGYAQLADLPLERALDSLCAFDRVAMRSDSMLARLAAVRAGLGVGVLGAFMAEPEPSLRRLPFALPEASSDLWIVVHADLRRNARVRAFVDSAARHLGELAPRFVLPPGARRAR